MGGASGEVKQEAGSCQDCIEETAKKNIDFRRQLVTIFHTKIPHNEDIEDIQEEEEF